MNANTIIKAVDGDFIFQNGSLRDKVYKTLRAGPKHTRSLKSMRRVFGKEPRLISAIHALRRIGKVQVKK